LNNLTSFAGLPVLQCVSGKWPAAT